MLSEPPSQKGNKGNSAMEKEENGAGRSCLAFFLSHKEGMSEKELLGSKGGGGERERGGKGEPRQK